MSKNLMVISQKVFAPASYIARKLNKKHHKHKVVGDLEAVQEKSQFSGYTSTDADANSLADVDFSWKPDKHDHSPTIESVVDCPAIDELEADLHQPINLAYPGSLNREATLTDTSGEILEEQRHRNTENELNNHFIKAATIHGVECHTSSKLPSDHFSMKTNNKPEQELTEIYALREKVSELEKIVSIQADEIACLKSAMADNLRRLQLLEESRIPNQMGQILKPNSLSINANSRRSTPAHHRNKLADITPVRKQISQTISASGRLGKSSSSARQSANNSTPSLNHIGLNKMSKSVTKSFTIPLSSIKLKLQLSKSMDKKLMKKSQNVTRPWRPAGTPNPEAPVIEKVEAVKYNKDHATNTVSSHVPSSAKTNQPRFNYGTKESTYNKDNGTIKIYIKGRPIILNVPSYAQPVDMDSQGKVSNETLKLEWVYGYRGRDSRNNVYYLPTGEVIYFIAAVVVLYNMEEQTQRHYLGHTDDVKSIAIHPDKITIATGQVAGHSKFQGKPHIRVWSSVSLNTLHILGLGEFERSVCCISFSKADGGVYICAVDEANEHVLSIWQWEKERRIVEAKSSTETILSVDFHPLENKYLVTCGKNHLAFWTFEDNKLMKKQAVYEKNDKPKFVLCQTFLDSGELITGDSSGNIIMWDNETHKIDKIILSAHEGPIFSILLTKSSTLLSGGGKDRRIKEWSSLLVSMGVEKILPENHGAIRMLSQGPGGMILVGSTRNSILQGNAQSTEFRSIVDGHVEEMWGLDTHPKQHRFVTVGYDRLLCYWDSLTRQLIWRRELTENLHSVCFHPLSEIIVIGCCGGRWFVIDTITREMVCVHTDGNEQIECVQFSTDGRLLAIGSRDNSIYVYHVSENGYKYSRNGKCAGHSSFITHIDWSINGQYLRSNSGDYEILYWSASTCRQVQSIDQVRDIDWATANCSIDWAVAGIWSEGMDGTDINAVDKGHHLPVLCAGDDSGRVNLYSYPFSNPKVPHHQYRGHSSHVTNVKFLFDDSRLISSGGKDSSIMQWEIL